MKSEAAPANVLLVDDNKNGLIARRLILEEHGFTVTTSGPDDDAWSVFEGGRFDVVVSDFRLKGMRDGELVRRIRESGSPSRIAILSNLIAVLGLSQENTGADELILKSAKEVTELVRVVRKLAHSAPRRKPVAGEARRKLVRRKSAGA